MDFDEPNYNDYQQQATDMIDVFVNSDIYKQICVDADEGDQDSLDMLQYLANMLGSLCFHLSNESGDDRIRYEMKQLSSYIDQWN